MVLKSVHTIGLNLSLGVQELSEINVIPNRTEAWNILGEKSLAFVTSWLS